MSMALAVPAQVQLTETGLVCDTTLSRQDWESAGRTLGRIDHACRWWIGDWLLLGEKRYGSTFEHAMELTGLEYDTLIVCQWVSSRYENLLRRRFSWSHHKVLAAVAEPERDYWMDWVEDGPIDPNTGEKAYRTVRELRAALRARRVGTPALPAPGRYRCIVIDPPWPMPKIEREVRPRQGSVLDYPTMSLEEIEALPIGSLAAEDGCHIYLWTTHKFAPVAFDLLEAWGFNYEHILTWIKPTGITPYSRQYTTELVLFGRMGSLPLERLGGPLHFSAPAVGHSVKPEAFYDQIRLESPEPRVDMFARKPRNGFDVWGNEVSGAD